MLAILQKLELPHRNNKYPPKMAIKYLSMPTSKTLVGICAEVDSQISHTSKITLFTKLENGLNLTICPKTFSLNT